MRLFTSICFVLALVCLTLVYVDEYQWGYYGTSYVPNALVDILCWSILVLILIGPWFVALFRKIARGWVTALLIGLFLLILVLPYVVPSKEGGLRDCVMKGHTPEDIRQLAREIEQGWGTHDGGVVFSRDEMTEAQKHLYDQLVTRYSFLHRGTGAPDPYIFQSDDNTLYFMWGGGFGHWGFCVGLNGHKIGDATSSMGPMIRVSDDIYFYSGD